MKANYDFSRAVKNPYASRLKTELLDSPVTPSEFDRIAIGISFPNCGSNILIEAASQFIVEHYAACDGFVPKPQPGIGGAVNLWLILAVAGSVASLANIVWTAYDKFIAGERSGLPDEAGILLSIRTPEGSTTLWLGKDVREELEFIRQLQAMLIEVRASTHRRIQEEIVEEIEYSGRYERMKKGREGKRSRLPLKGKTPDRRSVRH